ncbi:MAG TPA: hypothetical protein VMV06_07300 [Acidimicrobiales bacterium]|nr:hypothetical protein [Acidimicrobiales bacterium]
MAGSLGSGRRRVPTVAAAALVACSMSLLPAGVHAAGASGRTGSQQVQPTLSAQLQWSAAIAAPGGAVSVSSPNIADLPGGRAVVVGDELGYVDANYLRRRLSGHLPPRW